MGAGVIDLLRVASIESTGVAIITVFFWVLAAFHRDAEIFCAWIEVVAALGHGEARTSTWFAVRDLAWIGRRTCDWCVCAGAGTEWVSIIATGNTGVRGAGILIVACRIVVDLHGAATRTGFWITGVHSAEVTITAVLWSDRTEWLRLSDTADGRARVLVLWARGDKDATNLIIA